MIRPVLVPRQPTAADIELHLLDDPYSCARFLNQLTARARNKQLDSQVLRTARDLAHVLPP
jgi:hypothetical protein